VSDKLQSRRNNMAARCCLWSLVITLSLTGCASISTNASRGSWTPVHPEELIGHVLVATDDEGHSLQFKRNGELIVGYQGERSVGRWEYLGPARDLSYHLLWPTSVGAQEYVAATRERAGLIVMRGYYHAGDSLIRLYGTYYKAAE
jgi:hypothetical protein